MSPTRPGTPGPPGRPKDVRSAPEPAGAGPGSQPEALRTLQVTKDGRRIRRMFAGIARRYDLLNHVLSLNVDRLWRRRAVKALGLEPGHRVLDACTGTADLALELARRLDAARGGGVVGTDFCPEMVALGEGKRRRRGEERLRLAVADTLALPFPDASFDAVTVAFGIRNVADLRAGILELGRVLRPGGRLAILEFTTPRRRWLRRVYGLYFQRVLPRLGAWLSGPSAREGATAYSYLPASVAEFPEPPALARLLETCRLEDVSHRPLTGGIASLHLASRPAGAGPPRRLATAAAGRPGG